MSQSRWSNGSSVFSTDVDADDASHRSQLREKPANQVSSSRRKAMYTDGTPLDLTLLQKAIALSNSGYSPTSSEAPSSAASGASTPNSSAAGSGVDPKSTMYNLTLTALEGRIAPRQENELYPGLHGCTEEEWLNMVAVYQNRDAVLKAQGGTYATESQDSTSTVRAAAENDEKRR